MRSGGVFRRLRSICIWRDGRRRRKHEREQGQIEEGCTSEGQRFRTKPEDAGRRSAEAEEVNGGIEGSEDTEFQIPDPVVDAIEDGSTSVQAFREDKGLSQHDVAADAGMTDEHLAEIEHRRTPKDLEIAVLSDVLDVSLDLHTDK